MVSPLSEALAEFGHSQFDPCFDSPQWLVQSRGNLGMGESFVVGELNRLLLRLGQVTHSGSDRHTEFLIGLRLKWAWTRVGHLRSGSSFKRVGGPITS
jgi:hypothetical protein